MNFFSTRAAAAASFFFALSLATIACGSAAPGAESTVEAHGRVHDPAGVPLAAVRITLSHNGKVVTSTTTDSRGTFTLHVAPGTYDLAISDPPTSIEPVTVGSDTPPIDVAAYRSIGKVAVRSTTQTASNITHNDVPLANEPLTAIVVPPDVIASRGVTRLDQTIETVSDIERLPFFGSSSAYEVRGVIPQEYNTFRNGFRESNASSDDVINVDRVEVLKGPAGALLGAQAPLGGTVNVVTKFPTTSPISTIELESGSFATNRVAIDFGGPLDLERKVRYRLTAAYDRDGSYRDFIDSRSLTVAPAVQWAPTTKDTFTLLYEADGSAYVFDGGDPVGSPLVLQLPPSRNLNQPGDRTFSQSFSTTALWDHVISPNARLHIGYNDSSYDIDIAPTRNYVTQYDSTGQFLQRQLDSGPQSTLDRSTQIDFRADVPFGKVVNHFTVGFETTRMIYDYVNNLQTGQTIDIFNPVYGTLSPTLTPYGHGEIRADDTSGSISDLIDVTPRLNALLSARDDITGGGSDDYIANNYQRVSGRRATPRFGLVYKATTLDSLYASYEQGIAPQVGISKDGDAFVPNVADEVEIGYRRSSPGFSGTVAAYHLLINNLLTPDPTDPIYSVQSGQQQSRGIEVDLSARPFGGLSLTGSYALTDAKITRDNVLPYGTRIVGAPLNSGSLWSTYDIGRGTGVRFGLGFLAQGPRSVTFPESFYLPATTRVNALAAFRMPSGTLQLNLDNITNVTQYTPDGGYGLYPVAPFSARVRYTFSR